MFLQLPIALSLLKVALAASCDRTYGTSSGLVASPFLSSTSLYPNNLDCLYDIQVTPGFGIKLSWSTFDIKGNMPDCYDDYVEIYIGCRYRRHSIGKYCAEYGLSDMPFDVYSPDNCLRIKFHSNSSGAGKGFQGDYSAFSVFSGPSSIGAECSSYSESFPKTLISTSGVISSPRWPRDYPTLRDCYWRIDVDVGKNVKIAIMDFELERDFGCDNDKLKIKGGGSGDSYDRSDTIKDSMCGQKDPFYFTASDRRIWIRFKSNSFKTGRGFVIGYIMYDSKTGSGSSKRTSIIGIVVGIIIPIVIIACICYVCVYRRKQAMRAQQQGAVTMTVQNPPPPPPAGYGPPPQQGYAPPPQPGYGPPPQQGYAPHPQPGYGPPSQQGYGPPQQPGYPTQAPPPYGEVAGTAYPPQDKSGPYPYPPGQPSGVPPYPGAGTPYPSGQPGAAPPYPPGQPGAAPPYPPGQPGAVPPDPPGQPEGVPPYPPEQPAGGVSPYPSAPPTATAPPYPPQ